MADMVDMDKECHSMVLVVIINIQIATTIPDIIKMPTIALVIIAINLDMVVATIGVLVVNKMRTCSQFFSRP